MRKRININKKVLLILIIIILASAGYCIYYKNNNFYNEFESDIEMVKEIESEDEKNLQQKNNDKKITEEETEAKNQEKIVIHITGEVKYWGVLELEKGSRIIDAVNKAGGFTEEADTEKINLAYELTDGVKVYIPSKNIDKESNVSTQNYITTESGDKEIVESVEVENNTNILVNINEATQAELETLPGIGPSTALKIISYRKENGDFTTIEDIKSVSGIGENKFESIKDRICVINKKGK